MQLSDKQSQCQRFHFSIFDSTVISTDSTWMMGMTWAIATREGKGYFDKTVPSLEWWKDFRDIQI